MRPEKLAIRWKKMGNVFFL